MGLATKILTDFVPIRGGTVELRDDRIKKEWAVEIRPYELSKYQVTQDLFEAVTGTNPSTFKGGNRPVETVSWLEAVHFCNQLSSQSGYSMCYILDEYGDYQKMDMTADGFRLPTESEWQYACQAGSTDIRYGELDEIAWYRENSQFRTHDVGLLKPNDWGLYDMLGNVWEWCCDIYDESVYGKYRVFRGGGWCDVERSVMATTRRRSHPTSFRIDDLGFRISRNLPSP